MSVIKLTPLERENITETEKTLFLNDFKRVALEYFECNGEPSVDLTRTDEGFSVCVIFSARRIKKVNPVR